MKKNAMDLIGLCGFAGSGKDTVGRYIQTTYGYGTVSFADSLKDCLSVIFGWERRLLTGDTPESRLWREQVDPWWAEKLGIEKFTPRFAMTNFGTDVMRRHFNDEIWILTTEKKLIEANTPMVITDHRFPNEFAMTRRLGGSVYRVFRGENPEWNETAIQASRGCTSAATEMAALSVHESEWRWLSQPVDGYLDNSDDHASLYRQIDRIMNN